METVLTTQQKRQIAQSVSPTDTLITKIIDLFEKIKKDNRKITELNEALQSSTETTSYGFVHHVSFIKLLLKYSDYVKLLVQTYPDDNRQREKYLQILLMAYNRSTAQS